MIKVNLAPVDELESAYPYLPEVVTIVLVAGLAFFGVQTYIGGVQSQIDAETAKEQQFTASIQQLQPDLIKFKDLGSKIEDLNMKMQALKSITVSRISRYKPVIVIEHLQNLRPEGLWYSEFANGQDEEITLSGFAFDNILLAEFLMALRSTANQEVDETDLRTAVYFHDIELIRSALATDAEFPEIKDVPQFQIKMRFGEKPLPQGGDRRPPIALNNAPKSGRRTL